MRSIHRNLNKNGRFLRDPVASVSEGITVFILAIQPRRDYTSINAKLHTNKVNWYLPAMQNQMEIELDSQSLRAFALSNSCCSRQAPVL